MYFSETIINVKAVDKLPNCRSIILFPSLQAAATILATSKPCVVLATARKNIISMQGSIDILGNKACDLARAYLATALEKEVEEKIRQNQRQLAEVEQSIGIFNQAVEGINSCLEAMQLDRHRLPTLNQSELLLLPINDYAESSAELILAGDSN